MRQKYQERQADQLGALGLIVNMLVLWNALYMTKAIDYLQSGGLEVHDQDVGHLTPLGFNHIRFLGHYDFTLRAKPEAGGSRPLRRDRSS